MKTPASSILLSQLQPPPPHAQTAGAEQPPPSPVTPWLPALGGGGALLLLLLLGLGLRRARQAKKRASQDTGPAALPEPSPLAPKLRVVLAPSEQEAAQLQSAAAAHAEAEALRQQRAALAQSGGAEAAALQQLKEKEEEAKREEYRARKAAEVAARERRKRESLETERMEAEARTEAEALAAQQRAEREAQARLKIEAEGGRTLAQGLDRTRNAGFMARLNGLFGQGRPVDETVLAELEEILFSADIGVRTASHLVELARDKLRRHELNDLGRIKQLIREEVERIVSLPQPRSLEGGGPPHVTMVVGVNGAGKTTTIGKLAAQATQSGRQVVMAAGDTFRAAAAEQLGVWAQRAQARLVQGAEGSDPGSVVFEALKIAKESGAALVLADTAGRLHTKGPLMEELKKVKRVLDKAQAGAPHEVLLVLDATNGQNAIEQAKQFHEAVGVTALALTKLDGTAKGGVIIGICDALKLPVLWVGVGEQVADLRRFDPKEFVAALFD